MVGQHVTQWYERAIINQRTVVCKKTTFLDKKISPDNSKHLYSYILLLEEHTSFSP